MDKKIKGLGTAAALFASVSLVNAEPVPVIVDDEMGARLFRRNLA